MTQKYSLINFVSQFELFAKYANLTLCWEVITTASSTRNNNKTKNFVHPKIWTNFKMINRLTRILVDLGQLNMQNVNLCVHLQHSTTCNCPNQPQQSTFWHQNHVSMSSRSWDMTKIGFWYGGWQPFWITSITFFPRRCHSCTRLVFDQ